MEQHYEGGCQCGAVAYEVDVDVDGCMTCNCSRCQPLGAILAFAPRSQFKLLKGEDNLTEYRFNKKSIACRMDRRSRRSISIRCTAWNPNL
jgi:hypothetical protein